MDQDPSLRTSASRLVVPVPCRTGHLFAVSGSKTRHRRLSWCSLPVPKQSVGAWDLIPRPVGNRRDLAACAFMNPDVFLSL